MSKVLEVLVLSTICSSVRDLGMELRQMSKWWMPRDLSQLRGLSPFQYKRRERSRKNRGSGVSAFDLLALGAPNGCFSSGLFPTAVSAVRPRVGLFSELKTLVWGRRDSTGVACLP